MAACFAKMMRRASVAVCALSVTRRFHASASAAGGAVVRHPAPAFSAQALLPNGTFGTLKLSDYKGRWLVLASYPLDFTFVVRCRTSPPTAAIF